METTYEYLKKEINRAERYGRIKFAREVKGEIFMARRLNAITETEFTELTECIDSVELSLQLNNAQ